MNAHSLIAVCAFALLGAGCLPVEGDYQLSGTVKNLPTGKMVKITEAIAGEITLSADGQFSLPNKLLENEAYEVKATLLGSDSTTTGTACTVSNGKGTMGTADVTNIVVDCSTTSSTFTVSSSAFSAGGAIPLKHACNSYGGSNLSPQLSWSTPPTNTSSYVVIMDDETSPCGTGTNACKHWAVYNIPTTKVSFTEGEAITTSGVTQGESYTGTWGYSGPCPPSVHTYKITVYALNSSAPTLTAGMAHNRATFVAAMSSYILGSTTLSGTFTP